MKVREIMSAPVITVLPTQSVKEVALVLIDNEIGAVPVVNDHAEVVGIVTEADLIRLEQSPDLRSEILAVPHYIADAPRSVAEIMTKDVISLSDSADVAEVARAMLERSIKHVPILKGGQLVGIVARRDVLSVLARRDEEIAQDLNEILESEQLVLGVVEAEVADGIVTLTGPRDPKDRHLAEVLARTVPGVVAVRFSDLT